MSLSFNFWLTLFMFSFTQPHLMSDHRAKHIILTSSLTHTHTAQCATNKNFCFLRQKKNKYSRRVHKLMFYVANHTFYENNFFVLWVSFHVLVIAPKETEPKNFFSRLLKCKIIKKNYFHVSNLPEHPKASGRSMDSVSVNINDGNTRHRH